jgi:hypothetical protein
MGPDDSYSSWLDKRRSVEISLEFSKSVAVQIARDERNRRGARPRQEILRRWLEWVSLRPLAQMAIIVAGVVLGAVRLLATLQIILSS